MISTAKCSGKPITIRIRWPQLSNSNINLLTAAISTIAITLGDKFKIQQRKEDKTENLVNAPVATV